MRAGSARRCSPSSPIPSKVQVHAAWDSEEEARAIGEEIEQAQRKGHLAQRHGHPGARLVPDARVRGPLRHARPALPRHRRPALLRAHGNPRCHGLSSASSPSPPTISPSSASSTRPSAASATAVRRSTTSPAPAASRCWRRARIVLTEEMKPKPRKSLTRLVEMFTRWQERSSRSKPPRTSSPRSSLTRAGYTEMWQNDRSADAPGRLETSRNWSAPWRSSRAMRAFLEHVALVMDAEQQRDLDAVSIMTLHSAKGLEFETVFLPGWEEGPVPAPARARRGRPLRARGRAPPRLCRPHPRQAPLPHLVRLQPPHPRPVAVHTAVALPRRTARGPCRSRRDGHRLRRLWPAGVRRIRPLRRPLWRSRFDKAEPFAGNRYNSPGWQRAQANKTAPQAQLGHALRPRGRTHRLRRGRFRPARLAPSKANSSPSPPAPLGLHGRRPRLPPQIRQRQHRLHRRQQADHRFRQGRAEAGAGRVCGAGGVGGLLCPAVAPGCHSAIHPTPSPFPIPPPGNPRISPHAARRRPCGSARSWRFRAAAGSRAGRRGCARCRAGSRLPSPRPPSR
jgi:hypothetical protein